MLRIMLETRTPIGNRANQSQFPRARLFLNKLNLQLSPQYERALKDLKLDPTDQKLRRFSELYGKKLEPKSFNYY
jgi:hypothetical protein